MPGPPGLGLEMTDEIPQLPPELVPIAIRFADEGVPINVIARGLRQPAENVRESLFDALHSGAIVEMPRPDWPPTARRSDRVPSNFDTRISDEDLSIMCTRVFGITRLQSTVLSVLLKRDHAEKETLHNAVERRRFNRQSKPHNMEPTDPKMVDVVICQLRKKLKPLGIFIKTAWGSGYYMENADRKKAMAVLNHFMGEENGGPATQ